MTDGDTVKPGDASGNQERFDRLIGAHSPCVWISTHEEDDALAVVRQAAMTRGGMMWLWSMNGGMRDGLVAGAPGLPNTEHPAAALYHLTMHLKPCVAAMLDLAGHLRDERTLRLLRDAIDNCSRTGSTLVLIDHHEELPAVIRSSAQEFELALPDEEELEEILRATLREQNEQARLEVDLNRQELATIVRNLRGLSRRQARRVILDAVWEDRRFDIGDVNHILAEKRRALRGSGLLEYIEAPVHIDEIGGLRRLKHWLELRHAAFGKEAVEFGLAAPRGVLMLGVQGAGKSLAAKAVATAWQIPLMRLDAGALYDKYIGESERRLRDSLRQAEMMAPLVLWVDEIEKAFASAASRSTDGGLSQRMFGAMLTWMQERRAPVFVIATANDIEALPPELLRKGRFDEIFFVDLPDREARRMIFSIHLKRRKREPEEYDLDALAAASDGYSGAEIEQAIVAAMHDAFAAGTQVSTGQILRALEGSPPLSVVMAEKLEALRAWAKPRCVPAD